jgi:hypothetical protein
LDAEEIKALHARLVGREREQVMQVEENPQAMIDYI